MSALSFFTSLIRQGGLQEWEKLYLTLKPELLDFNVDIANKVASYSGYDERGNPATIMFPLIALMEHKVEEEQKHTLAILTNELIGRSRAEKKEHLLDTFELIEQLKKDVGKVKALNSYPSVLHSLNYIKQELSILHARLLSSPLETTPQELVLTIPSKRNASSLPTTFTYTGIKLAKTKRERETVKENLNSFARGLLLSGLVSNYSLLLQKESSRSVISELRNIFKGVESKHSVIWTGSNGELRFLVRQLLKLELIEPRVGHWKVAISCFKNENGNMFSETEISKAQLPTKTKKLNNIIQHLYISTR